MNRDIIFNCCTNNAAPDWTLFQALEIGGCVDHEGETEGNVPDDQAQFWTVYGRLNDGCCDAITDCNSRALAQEVAEYLSTLSGLPVR